jgi:hypothetical protein
MAVFFMAHLPASKNRPGGTGGDGHAEADPADDVRMGTPPFVVWVEVTL